MVQGFPGGKVVKSPPANEGDTGSTPGSGRSPGREDSNPLRYSCLENSQRQRGLVGSSLWGSRESDMPEHACSGGPVARNRCSHCPGLGSIPGQGTKVPQVTWCGQKQKSFLGGSLVAQWLRLHVPKAGGTGSFPGWGTKISHAARFSLKKEKKKLLKTQVESNTTLGVHRCYFSL